MIRTTRGRVVYTRKPHYFNCADSLRVMRCIFVGSRTERMENFDCYIIMAKILLNEILYVINEESELEIVEGIADGLITISKNMRERFEDAGSASFGGGGATREF